MMRLISFKWFFHYFNERIFKEFRDQEDYIKVLPMVFASVAADGNDGPTDAAGVVVECIQATNGLINK